MSEIKSEKIITSSEGIKSTIYLSNPAKSEANPIIFGPGIGERNGQLESIVQEIARTTERPVISYQSDSRFSSDPTKYIQELSDQYQHVIEKTGTGEHSIIGHSLFGLTLGAIIEGSNKNGKLQNITDIHLTSPMAVYELPKRNHQKIDNRAESIEKNERIKRTLSLMGRFAIIDIIKETKGLLQTGDLNYLKAPPNIIHDLYLHTNGLIALWPTISMWANTSIVPELKTAVDSGIPVTIYGGEKDPVFKPEELKDAIRDTSINYVALPGGHSNLATEGGMDQLRFVANSVKRGDKDGQRQSLEPYISAQLVSTGLTDGEIPAATATRQNQRG